MFKTFLRILFRQFVCLFLLLVSVNSFSQTTDEELLYAIRHDDLTLIKNYFKGTNNPNRLYTEKRLPLLHYAAILDKAEAIKILIDAGANIEKLYFHETPLMMASFYGNKRTVDLLIKKGANVNFLNKNGHSASIYAAKANMAEVLDILYHKGANFEARDCTGHSAIDYAYRLQHIESFEFISKVAENNYKNKAISTYTDGPYLFFDEKKSIKVTYLYSDSIMDKCFRQDSIILMESKPFLDKKNNFPFRIPIEDQGKSKAPLDKYKGVKKIMAVGDLHGGFDEFSNFLISNRVIDLDYNWIFGDGHLVVLGDVFDRGDKVTECFWLLYKLEAEAEKQNGRVHLILGNHEIMNFSGDKRYLSEKYIDLFNQLGLNYTKFYDKNTEIGRWLRNKNAILKINDILFVHGGISPELLSKHLTISVINRKIKEIINRDQVKPIDDLEEFLLDTKGPLWYRGYVKNEDLYYKVTGEEFDLDEAKLDGILRFYRAKTIVFANTNVKEVLPFYGQKLIGIDIPYTEPGVEFQALFIDQTGKYKAYADGRLEKLE